MIACGVSGGIALPRGGLGNIFAGNMDCKCPGCWNYIATMASYIGYPHSTYWDKN